MSETEQLNNAYLLKCNASLKAEMLRLKQSIKPIGRLVRDSNNQLSVILNNGAQLPSGDIDIFIKTDVYDGAGVLIIPSVQL